VLLGVVKMNAGTARTATRESPQMLSPTIVTVKARDRRRKGGGDEGTRTPDPLLAKEVLSQLSYIPAARRCYPMLGRWWAFLDSNQRPLPYQGSALTS
jgi:hypothetical protein